MNAITPIEADHASTTSLDDRHGVDLLYAPGERIFALAAPMIRARGWSIFPQERGSRRLPGRANGETIKWGRLCHAAADDAEFARWCKECPQLNVACAFGAASGNAFAIDIDVTVAERSERVQAIAVEHLGPTPFRRIGRAPRIALIYRAPPGGMPRSTSRKFREKGADGSEDGVEVLSDGKPLTFHGLHHVTGRYFQWPDLNPLAFPPSDAPEVTAEAVERFMAAVASEFPFKEASSATSAVGADRWAATATSAGVLMPLNVRGAHEGALLTDGREGFLLNLAWDLVRHNAPALAAAGAEGSIEESAGSVTAAAVETFEAACAMTGRWTPAFLRSQAAEKVGSAVRKLLAGDMQPPRGAAAPAAPAVARPALWADYLDIDEVLAAPPPPLDFVLPGILAGTLAVLVSPGGAGKSMLALGLGACVAAGRAMWGLLPTDPRAGNVLLVSAEDPRPVLAHRIHSLAHVPGGGALLHEDAGFRSRFRVKAVQGTGFGLGTWTTAGFQPSSAFGVLRREVEEMRPRLVILDTLNRCLAGIPENDNAALGRVVSELEAMVAPVGAACLVLHHVSKGAAREGAGDEQQAARGAGAITDNARWQGNLVGLTREDAEARGVLEGDRKRWVRWATSKNNYGEGTSDRWLWRDRGGVLRARDLPELPVQAGRGKGRLNRGQAE